MDQEEVRIKLGVDNSQVAPGLNDFKQRVDHAAKETHKSFLHASNGAKEFKKTIHEISNESPVLGLALKAALSPVGAMFTAATLAATAFKGMLDEVNTRLDVVAQKNATMVTDAGRLAAAVEARTAPENGGGYKSNFGGLLSSAGAALRRIFHPDEQDPKETKANRQMLTASRDELTRQAMVIRGQKDAADRDVRNPNVARSLERGRQMVEFYKGEIAKIQPNEAKLRENEVSDEKFHGSGRGTLGRWMSIDGRQIAEGAKRLLGLPTDAPNEELDKLQDYKNKLRALESDLKALDAVDKKNVQTLKEKNEQWDRISEEIKKVSEQLAQLPSSAATPIAGPISNIDPATGGIRYRGIADKGGIQYRPIKGAADDWMDRFNRDWDAAGNQQQDQVNALITELLNGLRDEGLPVSINVKE